MRDGRRIICEEIAKRRPFSVDEVYEVYEFVRKKKAEVKYVVQLDEMLAVVRDILQFAEDFQIEPMRVAVFALEKE